MFDSDNMSMKQFFDHMNALYRAMNYADSNDDSRKADWMQPQMAASWGCGHLDRIMRDLVTNGVISQDQFQSFYDNV